MKLGLRELFSDAMATVSGKFRTADLSLFHKFEPPPAGGGHQFMRALWRYAEHNGLRVENNVVSRTTRACLFNAFNFDRRRLKWSQKNSTLYVHRVDGPVSIIRGQDEGIDNWIKEVNHEFADKTILQSRYSLQKYLEMGIEFRNPVLVLNAADPNIFNHTNRIQYDLNRKIRIIATSWSANTNKGAQVYSWLDEHLDWRRYEFTFVGNSPITFRNIKQIPPVASVELAQILKNHDIYITASRNDPCSNSLIEALTCGLPAIYLNSGGHPEIVGSAGLAFDVAEEIPNLLEKLAENYSAYAANINLPGMSEVTRQYLKILEVI
jgi:glycosyltransferase involved in cell wall biosynthesis